MRLRLLRQLLPGTCLMCDRVIPPEAEPDLCVHCLDALPWNEPACARCAEPRARESPASLEIDHCPRCQKHPPPFMHALAPLRYEGLPRAWVSQLKDRLGMVEGNILGTLLARAAERLYDAGTAEPLRPPDLLIPVPLTARRLARRGHNQALTLARPVARRLAIPLWRQAVARRRPGRRQRGLSRAERLGNLEGTFAVTRHWRGHGCCIGIIDDVMTTGATAAELTRVLLAAGADEVHVLAATRTERVQWKAPTTASRELLDSEVTCSRGRDGGQQRIGQ